MQRDQLRHTGGALAAFDLDDKVIVDPQAVRRNVFGFSNGDASPQFRSGGYRREIPYAVGAVVQGALKSLQSHDRADEHRRKAEREQSVGDSLAARQFL